MRNSGAAVRALIIGAGPAGLAVGGALRQHSSFQREEALLIVDRAPAVGASWRGHYDRLRLHTERSLSSLPGLDLPPAYGRWVARNDVIAYLEDYARHHRLPLQLGTEVRGLTAEPERRGWRVQTSAGDLQAQSLIIATGYNHTPVIPDWPGRASFTGALIHSSAYRNPGPYRGKLVLVVGSGNSGAEIAAELSEGGAGRVLIAVRTPPSILPRALGPLSTQRLGILLRRAPPALVDPVARWVQRWAFGDLRAQGLPIPAVGPFTRARQGQIALLDVGFVRAVKSGRLTVVPGVRELSGGEVRLDDGQTVQPEVLIAATGFRRGLEGLVGHLGVLDERGLPQHHGAQTHPRAPGLHFIGYTNPVSGNLRELAIDATAIARRLAADAV